jgi:hypothetical protein
MGQPNAHSRLRDLMAASAGQNPHYASDAILILADGLEEAADATRHPMADRDARNAAALARELARQLQQEAPRHACPTRELLTAQTAPGTCPPPRPWWP